MDLRDVVDENLRSSGMLRGVGWLLVADISGQPISPIFKEDQAGPLKMGPIGCPETSVTKY
jgi:hypothetical protein